MAGTKLVRSWVDPSKKLELGLVAEKVLVSLMAHGSVPAQPIASMVLSHGEAGIGPALYVLAIGTVLLLLF